VSLDAQTRRKPRPTAKKPAVVVTTPVPNAVSDDPVVIKPEPKKNERPQGNSTNSAVTAPTELTYFYEFSQPEFLISKIVIQHDDAGKGTITFTRKMFDEEVTDPLQVSRAALDRINAAYDALNFLDSNASYQYEKDYSHLGVSTFRLKRAGKQRTTVFNFTVNKDAKALSDEYRKLANQFVWIFEITVARENQPLESPKLLDSLDALMRRNDLSDPSQMLPLLKELGNDERLPLIARNHATRLVEKIEKVKKGN
jgi:hypothetical protein